MTRIESKKIIFVSVFEKLNGLVQKWIWKVSLGPLLKELTAESLVTRSRTMWKTERSIAL